MFATGFITEPWRSELPDEATIVEWMRRTARRHVTALAGSAVVRSGGSFVNRLFFVRPGGGVERYDKRHLFSIGGEGAHFAAGQRRVVVGYGGLRFLLLVCYDLRFPVWSRCRGDYDAILCVASWPAARREVWRTLLRARAIENACYVVGVNRTGDDRGTGMPAIRPRSISGVCRSARPVRRRGSSRPNSTARRSAASGRSFPCGAMPTISCCAEAARRAFCGKIATFAGIESGMQTRCIIFVYDSVCGIRLG